MVAAAEDGGDLFPEALADVAEPEFVGEGVEAEAPGVAEADGEKFGADVGVGIDCHAVEGGGTDPGVVVGDFIQGDAGGVDIACQIVELDGGVGIGREVGIVVSRASKEVGGFDIDVDADEGGPEVFVEVLTVVVPVVLGPFVAPTHVEVAVRSEVEVAAVVVGALVQHFDEDLLGVGIGDGVGDAGGFPAGEALVVGAVVDADAVDGEEESVAGVVGVEGDAEEALFAGGLEGLSGAAADDAVKVEEDCFGRGAGGDVGNEFEVAGFFADEEALGVAGGAAEAEGLGKGEGWEGGLDGDRRLRGRGGHRDGGISEAGICKCGEAREEEEGESSS